jgi:hypothetical protein
LEFCGIDSARPLHRMPRNQMFISFGARICISSTTRILFLAACEVQVAAVHARKDYDITAITADRLHHRGIREIDPPDLSPNGGTFVAAWSFTM